MKVTTPNEPAKRATRKRTQNFIEAKIVLLGDSGVGKSSIAQRFCFDKFDELHDVTIGGAYMQKLMTIQPDQPGQAE